MIEKEDTGLEFGCFLNHKLLGKLYILSDGCFLICKIRIMSINLN